MSVLTPTPVPLESLINSVSDINAFNDGVKTQVVSPRTTGVESITVQVTDDPTAPVVTTGTADANVVNTLVDTSENFVVDHSVEVGDVAVALVSGLSAVVTNIITTTNPNDSLVFATDIFPLGTETYKIMKPTYWVQKFGGGEWKKSNIVDGNNVLVAYTLPVNTATVNVHAVVYPWVIADIANYPAA